MAIGGANLHVIEGVADVRVSELIEPNGIRIVRLNGEKRDTLAAVIVRQFLDAGLVELGGRTVIASKNDDQDLGRGVVAQFVRFAVYARKGEIGRGGTECERSVRLIRKN